MNYIEVNFKLSPFEPWSDVLAAELGELGFESFLEEDGLLKTYVTKDVFNEELMKGCSTLQNDSVQVSYTFQELEQQNWNKEWESNFSPVYVADQICVRATFHDEEAQYPFEIIIDPKMSFGTGHHSTTHLMLAAMLEIDFKGKSVLDMGSGTGVLAIFAAMRGAKPVYAIDIDEWCSVNARENAAANGVGFIQISQGDKEDLEGLKVDVLMANINRNILIEQMDAYAKVINFGGELHISGFYQADVSILVEEANKHGLVYVKKKSMNDWTTVKFKKK